MKEYSLIADPQDSPELLLFANIGIHRMAEPVSIQREEPLAEEPQPFTKKRSEVIEHPDPAYNELREREQEALLVSDSDSHVYAGKLQDVSDTNGIYFAVINAGSHLRLVPVSRWYRFAQRCAFAETDTEVADKWVAPVDDIGELQAESDEGADFEPSFADDEGEELPVIVESKKTLTLAGERLQSLVETYDKETPAGTRTPPPEEAPAGAGEGPAKGAKRAHTADDVLTEAELRKIIGTGALSVRDLLRRVSARYTLGDHEKTLVRDFIRDHCQPVTNQKTGEKQVKLRQ